MQPESTKSVADQATRVPVPAGTRISVMSWNILADVLCKPIYFPYASASNLSYPSRIERTLATILKRNPDLLFLQEVDDRSEFERALEHHGYELMYLPKRFCYNAQGVLLAYRATQFELLRFQTLQYSGEETGWRHPEEVKGNNAIIMHLREKCSQRTFYVANTHLFWDPKQERIKYYQFTKLLTLLKESAHSGEPIIVAGDLNSVPGSNLIRLVKFGESPTIERTQLPEDNFKRLADIYNDVKNRLPALKSAFVLQEHKPTNAKSRDIFRGMIDYVFYSEQVRLVKAEELPDQAEYDTQKGLPNSTYPSDHIPLVCEFEWS